MHVQIHCSLNDICHNTDILHKNYTFLNVNQIKLNVSLKNDKLPIFKNINKF